MSRLRFDTEGVASSYLPYLIMSSAAFHGGHKHEALSDYMKIDGKVDLIGVVQNPSNELLILEFLGALWSRHFTTLTA